nr:hypothetical protein [Methylorubrum aminovorans]
MTWTEVHIARDKGTLVEVDKGLSGGERLVLSPPPTSRTVGASPPAEIGQADASRAALKAIAQR